jgi:protein involved in plasmid replication-relaxation
MQAIQSSLSRSRELETLPAMRFQARDEIILRAIYEVGGVVSKRQLKEMFWPDKTWRAMEKRLSKLYHHGYLDWPDRRQWRSEPIPEPVCWLGWKGVLVLGRSLGLQVGPVSTANENQQRKLEGLLRKQGLHWLREPRWIQLEHDLAVVDFRLNLERSLREHNSLSLGAWLHEGIFRSNMDVVEVQYEAHNGTLKRMKKGVCPDAYFVIEDEKRRARGEPHRARFLLELDNATHDNPSFGLEKALAGKAYLDSPAYERRFGSKSGRWLVVTTAGPRRLQNLMDQTRAKVGKRSDRFWFTTFEDFGKGNLLTGEIWHQADLASPVSLISTSV